ncbi:hypothetical protein DPMN_076942 [Dreissena polymorpha]|uniref:Uncharacterized protein n=1 Tax=Dreissena polymorpha TaxID=45954 RepID=A0A9D4BMV1_DREPO|nr:hypothetical protein DPMN_076942 [Dreissena polymorpha]
MKDTLTKLQAPLKSDVDKCPTLRGELKQLGDAFQDISDKSKQELSLIATLRVVGSWPLWQEREMGLRDQSNSASTAKLTPLLWGKMKTT